ncbi:MAG: ATP-dependent helicase [Burkholderiaceae bacterium]
MSDPIFVPAGLRPTDEQQLIQTTRARHVLIEANAGAAKTTTLALRIAQALWRGADPAMILALTYTAPAVQALRRQLRFIGLGAEQIAGLRIHSFESFSTWLLAGIEGGEALGLASQEQLKPYVLRAIERAQTLPQERHPDELLISGTPTGLVEGLLRSFALIKGRMLIEQLPPDEPPSPALAEDLGVDYLTLRVRSAYELIRRGGHPDRPAFRGEGDASYDLARAVALGELDGGEGSPFALGLALIVVDEMHDTNRAMFTLLKALLDGNRRAAFVGVGDRDQVIHSQAGAESGFMQEHFAREIGAPLRLPLTASHRFGARLARSVGLLARKPYAAFQQRDTEIELLACESHRVMARMIANLAREHMAQSQREELRILLRQPAHSILIERELLNLHVGYEVQGFQPFLRRPEVLLVRGLFAWCSDDFSGFDSKSLRADALAAMLLFAGSLIDSAELRHLDAVSAQRRAIDEAAAHPDGMRPFIEGQVLRNASAAALPRLRAAIDVLKSGDLQVFAGAFLPALDARRLASSVLVRQHEVRQVCDNLAQLVRLLGSEGGGGGLGDAFRLLDALQALQSRMRANRRVTLSSIEVAKGLEFDHVLIPHLSRGEFVGAAGAAENRNLLYVAMTRARQRLTLAYDPAAPSRFLLDAGLLAAEAG